MITPEGTAETTGPSVVDPLSTVHCAGNARIVAAVEI
jgi:hypothetical protein